MVTDKATKKIGKFEAVYRAHADNIYKLCIYYLQDEKKAEDVAKQTFFNFYQYFERVAPDTVFKCLVCEMKNLLSNSQHQKFAREGLEECTTTGKN